MTAPPPPPLKWRLVPLTDAPCRRFALVVEFNRPATLHSFDAGVYAELGAALAAAEADDDVLAVLLCSVGRVFSSGADVTAPAHPATNYAPLLRRLAAFPKLIAAAVQGPAVGIAATILLHCDVVHAARGAWLSTPFAAVGVVPEAASSRALPLRLGTSMATEMLLAGRRLTAEEALRCGIVSAIVDVDGLGDDARNEAVVASVMAVLRRVAAAPMAGVVVPMYKALSARWAGAHAGDGAAALEAELPWLLHRYDRGDPFEAAAARMRGGTVVARL